MAYDLHNLQSVTCVGGDERYSEVPEVEGDHRAEAADLLLWRHGARSVFELAYGVTDDKHQADQHSTFKKPSPEEKRIREARAKLVRLRQAIRAVTSRIKYLDSRLQAIASNGEIKTIFTLMMKQLEQLNIEVQKNPNRFESIMINKYDGIMKTISALHVQLNELETQTMNSVG